MTYYESFKDVEGSGVSGLVLSDDGLFYAMYKHPVTNKLTYISNDGSCGNGSHYMSLVVAKAHGATGLDKKSANEMMTHSYKCETIYMSPLQIQMRSGKASKPLTAAERAAIREIAYTIWDKSIVSQLTINQGVADVVGFAVHNIRECSKTMKYVPTSPGYVTKPGREYLVKYAKAIVKDHLGIKKKTLMDTKCIKSVARNTVTGLKDTQENN